MGYGCDHEFRDDLAAIGAAMAAHDARRRLARAAPRRHTDFHSATPASDSIFIIGCLGYPEQRIAGRTPAYRLALETMAISPVETSGEAPGWFQLHSAKLSDDGRAIVVRGGEVWLDASKWGIEPG